MPAERTLDIRVTFFWDSSLYLDKRMRAIINFKYGGSPVMTRGGLEGH